MHWLFSQHAQKCRFQSLRINLNRDERILLFMLLRSDVYLRNIFIIEWDWLLWRSIMQIMNSNTAESRKEKNAIKPTMIEIKLQIAENLRNDLSTYQNSILLKNTTFVSLTDIEQAYSFEWEEPMRWNTCPSKEKRKQTISSVRSWLIVPLIERGWEQWHWLIDYWRWSRRTRRTKYLFETIDCYFFSRHFTFVNVINNPRILVTTIIPINMNETYCDQNCTSNWRLK